MQKPNERLKNQTAIVTGSSTGIGAAVALALGRDGANVVVNYHSSEEEAQEVADQINKESLCGEAIIVQCDVSKEEEVQAMFKRTIEKFGTVDILLPIADSRKMLHFTR